MEVLDGMMEMSLMQWLPLCVQGHVYYPAVKPEAMPSTIFVTSKRDIAGQNIIFKLRELVGLGPPGKGNERFDLSGMECMLIDVDVDIVHVGRMAEEYRPSLVIHLSRHSSAAGIPTLSVHVSGNISDADMGGEPKTISVAPAMAMLAALKELQLQREAMNLDFNVCYEATHHGPSLDVPSMFIEIGSNAERWRREDAGQAVARAALAAARATSIGTAAIGLGGTHYCPKFTKLAIERSQPFGHILPKYALGGVDGAFLGYAMRRTLEPVDSVLIDWKGISGMDKERLMPEVEKLGLRIERI